MESLKSIKKFGESTSMHGAPKVILTKSPIRRGLWLIIFLASWAMFISQMYYVCGRYFRYPKRVNVDVTENGVPFPWITICNMHGFDFHLVNRMQEVFDRSKGINISLLGNSSADQFIRKYNELYTALNHPKNTMDNQTRLFLFAKDVWQANIPLDLLSNNSITFKDFFVSCEYSGEECRYGKDVLLHFNWYYFNCYRYIGVQGHDTDQGQGQDTDLPELNEGVSDGWSAVVLTGRGMLGKRNKDQHSIPGIHEAAKSTGGSEGVRVVIHPPNTMAFPMIEGYDVPPGYSASLAFRPGVVKRIDKPYGTCYNNTEEKKNYRESLCMGICHEEMIRKRCDCIDVTMPHSLGVESSLLDFMKYENPSMSDKLVNEKCRRGTSGIPKSSCRFCQFINLNTSISSTDRISEYTNYTKCMKEVRTEISKNFTSVTCGCKPACHEYTYDVTYSLSKWPTTGYEGVGIWTDIFEARNFLDNFNETTTEHKLYRDYVNSNDLNVLEDFSRINVYVRDSSVLRTTEEPDYLLFQLLSDVGGQLGIWIGVSAITVTEAFEMMFLVIRNAMFRICKRRKITENDLEAARSECDKDSSEPGDQLKSPEECEMLKIVDEVNMIFE